ncbi:glycerophosphodiester phosphodiesterase [Lysinibacillus sp. LZ02]|uniref:glycerophosphodiester phosphodiesterase n=1 Tax=Lysinibacillus sp. LZ02 TaxID=3420668 RepID=UPI003D361FF2
MTKYIPVYAHRGASGYALENTFEAFDKARILKADGIELDIQRSKDDVLFVFHDLHLKRLTGVSQLINECTAEEVSELKLGRRFFRLFARQRIPTLEKVFHWANEHHMPLNIELKESLIENIMPFIRLLKTVDLPNGSHVSSFHDELLRAVKVHCPHIETAIIVTKKFEWDRLHEMHYINAVHAHKRYYQPRFLDICNKTNKPMRFYSIRGNEHFLASPHSIVGGWITDYPDRVVKRQT